MRAQLNKYAIAILLTVSATMVFYHNSYRAEQELLKTKITNDFQSKYSAIERRLYETERLRDHLVHRLDSIDNANLVLTAKLKDADVRLSKVKGTYDKRTPSELELEMIRRWQKK